MLGTTKYITLKAAQAMMAAAEGEARANNWNMATAIVDAGGNLKAFARMDGAAPDKDHRMLRRLDQPRSITGQTAPPVPR